MQRVEVKKGATQVNLDLTGHSYVHILNKEGQRVASMRGNNPQISFNLPPGEYTVETDGKAAHPKVVALPAQPVALMAAGVPAHRRVTLTHDGKNLHPVDGAVLLPADGKSFLSFTVQKVDGQGAPLTEAADQDAIYIRTTGGILQDQAGKPLAFKLALVNGTAHFRLLSEPQRRAVTVQILTAQPELAGDQLLVEFV